MFTGISAVHLVTILLKLVLGAVALTLACLWTPQKGKVLFCIFVGVAFVVSPLLEVTVYGSMLWAQHQPWNTGFRASQGDYRFFMLLMQMIGWAQFLLNFASVVLLIAYAAVRCRAGESNAGQITGPADASAFLPNRRWDTHLPASQLVDIARRREWAHAVDCLPALLLFSCYTLFVWPILIDNSYRYRDERTLLMMLSVLATFGFLVYLLMKDCIGGVSVGKWFTRCRVVDAASGIPASVPQTMLRNAIFLFFPIGSIIELAVANFRPDRKRLGDQWAGTMVVYGPAQIVDGFRVPEKVSAEEKEKAPKKHPLDD
jgi:uncharacterized RDD family membrane protein YckC